MYISWLTWNPFVMGLPVLFRNALRQCIPFMKQMGCIYILRLPSGTGLILLIMPHLVYCKWIVTGSGIRNGAAMPGIAIAMRMVKLIIGQNYWVKNMVVIKNRAKIF